MTMENFTAIKFSDTAVFEAIWENKNVFVKHVKTKGSELSYTKDYGNILSTISCDNGYSFMIMPKYEKIDARDIKQIFIDICNHLQVIHADNCVHGDIKESNIMKYNDKYILIDFGLTCAEGRIEDQVTGSELYSSIDQDLKHMTFRGDLWSLIYTLHTLEMQENPFEMYEDVIKAKHFYKPLPSLVDLVKYANQLNEREPVNWNHVKTLYK